MKDKQIIIDGIDVSGCNFTLERDGKIKCECCHATGFGVICDCESWKTCDYKNYKRKEQECEQLRGEIWVVEENLKDYIEHYNRQCEQLDQLKAENDELKKQVDDLLHKPEIQDKILWKIDNEALLGSKDAWIYKLEQTLAKVKELAEHWRDEWINDIDEKQGFEEIIEKISEVE